jgi:hypothetical protein
MIGDNPSKNASSTGLNCKVFPFRALKSSKLLTKNWQPGVTLVSFEDLWGTPAGQYGYNDLSFSFTNPQTTPVPETSGLLLMLLGWLGGCPS